jgi:tungstate transport system ATP-binding protein
VSLFSLKGVRQVFGGRTVLEIDDLEMAAGESYALLGPNGCGKTTLLHILAFLRPPVQGELRFNGRLVDWRKKTLRFLRQKVVLVDQHPIMFTTTVLKNVEYGPKMRGVSKAARQRIAEECLELTGLREFASRPAHKLSGGETQRVAIARALACQPEVLLFDEPTTGVDVENQAVIEGIIETLRKDRGITIIFSTHKRLEAARLANKKIFLVKGQLTDLRGENLLSGRLVRQHGRTVCIVADKIALETALDQTGPTRVFIKPEGIRLIPLNQSGEASYHNFFSGHGLFPGRVLQLAAEGEDILALVDIGVTVKAILSRQEVLQLGILAGDQVRVAIAPDAVVPVQ